MCFASTKWFSQKITSSIWSPSISRGSKQQNSMSMIWSEMEGWLGCAGSGARCEYKHISWYCLQVYDLDIFENIQNSWKWEIWTFYFFSEDNTKNLSKNATHSCKKGYKLDQKTLVLANPFVRIFRKKGRNRKPAFYVIELSRYGFDKHPVMKIGLYRLQFPP